jgi:hypothetical protein
MSKFLGSLKQIPNGPLPGQYSVSLLSKHPIARFSTARQIQDSYRRPR